MPMSCNEMAARYAKRHLGICIDLPGTEYFNNPLLNPQTAFNLSKNAFHRRRSSLGAVCNRGSTTKIQMPSAACVFMTIKYWVQKRC